MKLTEPEASALLARLGDPFENPLTYAEEGVCVVQRMEPLGEGAVYESADLHRMTEAE